MTQLLTKDNVLLKTSTAIKSRFVFDSIDFINIEYISFFENYDVFKLKIENSYPTGKYNGVIHLYNDKSFSNISDDLYEYGTPKPDNLYLNNFFNRYDIVHQNYSNVGNVDYNELTHSPILELSRNVNYKNLIDSPILEISWSVDYINAIHSPMLELSRNDDYRNIIHSPMFELTRNDDYENISMSQAFEISRANDFKNIALSQALEISRANDYKNIALSQALEISRANDFKNIALSQALEISRANDYKNIALSQSLEISRANDYKNIALSQAFEISRANDYKNITTEILSSPLLFHEKIVDSEFAFTPTLSSLIYKFLGDKNSVVSPHADFFKEYGDEMMSWEFKDSGTSALMVDKISPADVKSFYGSSDLVHVSDTGYTNHGYDQLVSNDSASNIKTFYEDTLDIEFNVMPAYINGGDPIYKHVVSYVDIHEISGNSFFNFNEISSDDNCYIQDQQYMRTKVVVPDTMIFKYQPLSERFYPHHETFTDGGLSVFKTGRYHIVNKYEYSLRNFVLSSQLSSTSKKLIDISLYKPTSIHEKYGGSQHSGHDCVNLFKMSSCYSKKGDHIHELKYNRTSHNTRNDTIVSNNKISKLAWIEVQMPRSINVDDAFENILVEFDEIDWNLIRNTETTRYNFTYELREETRYGRLPDNLIFNNNTIKGKLGLNDVFINKHINEDWVKNNNYLTDDGINISKDDYTLKLKMESEINPKPFTVIDNIEHYNIEYPNMDNINSINTFKVEFIGSNEIGCVIDIILPDIVGDIGVLNIGERINQTAINGKISSGIVTKYIGRYTTYFDIGHGVTPCIIDRYEISNMTGLFQSTYNIINTSYKVIEENGIYTKVESSTAPIYYKNYIPTSYGELLVSNVDVGGNRGIVKQIHMYFPIRKNYTYNRDLFLFKSQKIPDTRSINNKELSRVDWIELKRNNHHFRFNDDYNNERIESAISNLSEDKYMVDLSGDKISFVNKHSYSRYTKSLISNFDETHFEVTEDISPFIINNVSVSEEDFYNKSTSVQQKRWSRYARGK